jgi:hypothetical protein
VGAISATILVRMLVGFGDQDSRGCKTEISEKWGGVRGNTRCREANVCRRAIPLGVKTAKMILEACRKIKEGKHVIFTVPEHRLSFENKAIELASDRTMAKHFEASKSLH